MDKKLLPKLNRNRNFERYFERVEELHAAAEGKRYDVIPRINLWLFAGMMIGTLSLLAGEILDSSRYDKPFSLLSTAFGMLVLWTAFGGVMAVLAVISDRSVRRYIDSIAIPEEITESNRDEVEKKYLEKEKYKEQLRTNKAYLTTFVIGEILLLTTLLTALIFRL